MTNNDENLHVIRVSADQFREMLEQILEAGGDDVRALDEGSGHPYHCTCETCWKWWHMMGIGDEGAAAPFSEAQINAESYQAALALPGPGAGLGIEGVMEAMFARHRADMEANPCAYGNHAWVAHPRYRAHYCANCPATSGTWPEGVDIRAKDSSH